MSYMEPWKMIKVRESVHKRMDKLRNEDFKSEYYWSKTTFGELIEKLIKFYNEHKPEDVEEVEP